MIREEIPRTSNLFGIAAIGLIVGVCAAIFAAGVTSLVDSSPARATAAFTAQTKLPCTRCHTKANGASADNLTDFGKQFHANDNKLPKK
jgi:hypothetical protein